MRLGIYGGSFDPVHLAHLLLAESARTKLSLDRIEFLPLGVPPHLKNIRTSGEDRYQMLTLALAPFPEFTVGRFEIDNKQISYTANTLDYYFQQFPNAELFLILSSETFNDLPNWRNPEHICEIASLVVAQRAGYPPPNFERISGMVLPSRLESFRNQVVSMPQMAISSTLIRELASRGESIRFLTPEVVVDYIKQKNLYRV